MDTISAGSAESGGLRTVALVMSMGVSALAAVGDVTNTPVNTGNFTVTITKDTTDKAAHTYGAYQIFAGDLAETETAAGSANKKVLSNIVWGSGIDSTKIAQLLTDLNAIDGLTIAATATAADVAKAIGEAGLTFDNTTAQAVADAFNKALASPAATGTIAAAGTEGTITGLKAGYYLIKDTTTVSGEGASTRFMLEVVSDVAVTEKASVPTVTKKVKEKNDTTGSESGWQDAADYDIGDTIPYQITGTLPSKFAEFDTYKTYTITDTLSAGLTAPATSAITVKVGTTDVTGHFDINVTGEATAEQTITIKLKTGEDLKTWTEPALTKDSTFVVDYTATLNDSAVIVSAGNPNTVKLEFSNNPNYDGDGDKGTTPDDKVIVFTYKTHIDKIDSNNAALTGADFTFYKEVLAGTDGAQTGAAIKNAFTNGSVKAAATALEDTKSYIVVGNKTGDATGSTFEFKGMDAGTYVLVETTIPAGYNAWTSVKVTIDASYDTDSADPKLLTLTATTPFTIDNKEAGEVTKKDNTTYERVSGEAYVEIQNNSGTELPSTGGIGTTIFYIVGSIIVIAAGVLLISKKRMAREG